MLRSFEQKRRNRPIIITDVAISKVPMIQFQGFSKELLKNCDKIGLVYVR